MFDNEEDLEKEEVEAVEAEEAEADEVEEAEETEEPTEAAEDAEPEAFAVSLGDEEPEEDEDRKGPSWVTELRRQNRAYKKKIEELEAAQTQKVKAEELGPKPTLEAMDYDEEKFEQALISWQEKKRAHDASAAKQAEEAKKVEEAYLQRLEAYQASKGEIAKQAPDFDDAEDDLKEIFDPTKQGLLLDAAKDPALMVYALGKNPKKARELAAETNVVRFVAEIARLEQSMKVTGVKKPSPEKRVGSAASAPKSPTTTLSALHEEAKKTGDYTRYFAMKRKMPKKG